MHCFFCLLRYDESKGKCTGSNIESVGTEDAWSVFRDHNDNQTLRFVGRVNDIVVVTNESKIFCVGHVSPFTGHVSPYTGHVSQPVNVVCCSAISKGKIPTTQLT